MSDNVGNAHATLRAATPGEAGVIQAVLAVVERLDWTVERLDRIAAVLEGAGGDES